MAKVNEMVKNLLEDFLPDRDTTLWDTEFVKEGRDWFLRVYVDRTDGEYISTDDCEAVSNFLSEKLDEKDPIEQNYYLEVSSPGLDRTLKTREHFEMSLGKQVEVSLYSPLAEFPELKLKKLEGVLMEYIDYSEAGDAAETGEKAPAIRLSVEIDKKAHNRKPGAKVGKSALVQTELVLPLSGISKVNLAVIF